MKVINFKYEIKDVKFSPNGKLIAVIGEQYLDVINMTEVISQAKDEKEFRSDLIQKKFSSYSPIDAV